MKLKPVGGNVLVKREPGTSSLFAPSNDSRNWLLTTRREINRR